MDIPNHEATEVDMTKSGRYCWKDGKELERVSEETRYTCHECGAVYEEKGDSILVHFEGFE